MARLFHLRNAHGGDRLVEAPDMPFRVEGAVDAGAVELIARWLRDPRPRRPGPCAMLIDPLLQGHPDELAAGAVHRRRALHGRGTQDLRRGPLAADPDLPIREAHFSVSDRARGVGDQHAGLEAERLFEPL